LAGKILLVEDEETILNQLKQILDSVGYEVLTASDGEAGWAVFVQYSPSAVITGLRKAEGRRDDAAFELERLAQELTAVPRDAALATLVTEIDQWKDLSGKILAARSDCPKREAEWKRLYSTRDGLCGVRDIKVRAVGSCGASLRPEIFEPLIEPAATQGDDGVGAS